jgi:hypothetical protein
MVSEAVSASAGEDPSAHRIITMLGIDDIENLRRLTAAPRPRDGLQNGVTGVLGTCPGGAGVSWTLRVSVNLNLPEVGREANVHSHRYRITIEGDLGRVGCSAFEEFNIVSNDGHTSLVADLDQPTLYGALIRIQSLGLELVELARIPSEVGSQTTAGPAT